MKSLFSSLSFSRRSRKVDYGRLFLDDYAEHPTPFNHAGLPLFPLEIWRRIFEMLLCAPLDLSIHLADPFEYPSRQPLDSSEATKERRITRTACQLVCRSWRVVVLEYLYESLFCCCNTHFEDVVKILEETKQQDPEGAGRGRWVKRVEFMEGACSKSWSMVEPDLVVRLLKCTPNLRVYSNFNNWMSPRSTLTNDAVVNGMAMYCGDSLLRLEWGTSEGPFLEDLKILLYNTPRLQTLAVAEIRRHGYCQCGAERPQLRCDSPVVLKELKQLRLGPFSSSSGRKFNSWQGILDFFTESTTTNSEGSDISLQLPSLTHLWISPLEDLRSYPSAEQFFTRYGPQLQFLQVGDFKFLADTDSIQIFTLRQVLDLTPNLKSLALNPIYPLILPSGHPSLERVAVHPPSELEACVPPRLFRAQIEVPLDQFFKRLAKGDFPRLKLVRMRDLGTFADLENVSGLLDRWLVGLKDRGIRFENRNGLDFTFLRDAMEEMPDF